jgi:hypothetical protein
MDHPSRANGLIRILLFVFLISLPAYAHASVALLME